MPDAKPLSIYIHFPYCRVKCPFCNLNAWESADFDEQSYIRCVEREADAVYACAGAGYRIETVFFGGGTPSLFSGAAVARAMEAVSKLWPVAQNAEVSIEAHPLSCGHENLRSYRSAGVNRISIGVQSFLTEKLESLGRKHGADMCFESVTKARKTGFENISTDIIAGAPGETCAGFEKDIRLAAETRANHFSVYGLEVERGTPFYSLQKRGSLFFPSEEQVAEMMETAAIVLGEYGMERYEISSFAAGATECRHNLNYWRSGDYIGFGAGAHSHITTPQAPFGRRWANPRDPAAYMRGTKPEVENISPETGFSDTVMMGLRLAEGINLESAENRFGMKTDRSTLETLSRGGLITAGNGTVRITDKGRLVANSVMAEIVAKTAPVK